MQSVMGRTFSRIAAPPLERSTFDRSRGRKTTFDAAELIPCFLEEVLPGDVVSLSVTYLARLQSLFFPIMDNIFFDWFFFFVPERLVWKHWPNFMANEKDAPDDTTEYIIPTFSVEGSTLTWDPYTLGDYFCLPTAVLFSDDSHITSRYHRGYNLIWNTWFRDQNLQDPVVFTDDDGPDDPDDYRDILKRGKRHDYFTSCLLEPQKGESIKLPIGTTAPVIGDGQAMGFIGRNGATGDGFLGFTDNTGFNGTLAISSTVGNAGDTPFSPTGTSGDRFLGLHTDATKTHVFADLTNAVAATINQLREAFAFQQILELDARSGTRYTEYLQATWHQNPEDFRLQRPEYLGGSSKIINVSAVQQTSGSPATISLTPGQTPQGNLAAHAQGSGQAGFHKSFVEHGFIMGICNVRSDITYQQGLDRMWTRRTRFDFPHPALMHLGEQAVKQQEIWATGVIGEDEIIFGYQERWAEYRYAKSEVNASFRSNLMTTLDAWHLATEFTTAPTLGAAFIEDDPPLDRVIAVPNQKQIFADMYFNVKSTRQMPAYSTPGLMGRF